MATFKGLDNKGNYKTMPNTFKANGMTFLCDDKGFIIKQSDDGITVLRGRMLRAVGFGVGRSTGQKDKNEAEIFENDYLKVSTALYLVQDSASGFVAKAVSGGGSDTALSAEFAATAEVVDNLAKTPVIAAPEAGTTNLWGHLVSSLQSDVAISNGAITGSLSYINSGSLKQVWGAGNFLALKFTDFADADKIMVGLVPSVSSGLVALDEDMNAVFKITDKAKQVLVVDTYKDEDVVRQKFTLTGLTLATS